MSYCALYSCNTASLKIIVCCKKIIVNEESEFLLPLQIIVCIGLIILITQG